MCAKTVSFYVLCMTIGLSSWNLVSANDGALTEDDLEIIERCEKMKSAKPMTGMDPGIEINCESIAIGSRKKGAKVKVTKGGEEDAK